GAGRGTSSGGERAGPFAKATGNPFDTLRGRPAPPPRAVCRPRTDGEPSGGDGAGVSPQRGERTRPEACAATRTFAAEEIPRRRHRPHDGGTPAPERNKSSPD